MSADQSDAELQVNQTEVLLERIAKGNAAAADTLLGKHRQRLTSMVRWRMDRRLAARLDASDVVQDVLTVAYRRLPNYVAKRPMPFYPWLRQLAWERLVQLHRDHVLTQRRAVGREEQRRSLAYSSEAATAPRLADSAANASAQAIGREVQQRVRSAIQQLPARAREIVTMRHLEEMSFKEIAAALRVSDAAVFSRYRRAAEQLSRLLAAEQ